MDDGYEDEDLISQSIRGFGLNQILAELQLPHSDSLDNQLGLTGLSTLNVPGSRIYGPEEGYIDDVEVSDEEPGVKIEAVSPFRTETTPPRLDSPQEDLFGDFEYDDNHAGSSEMKEPPRKKRKKAKGPPLQKRAPNIAELFPTFRENAILNFTDLFIGRAIKKPRTRHKPLYVEAVAPKERPNANPFPLDALIGDIKRTSRIADKRVSDPKYDIDVELRRVMDICLNDKGKGKESKPPLLPLDDRSYDLILLGDWENDIHYDPPEPKEQTPSTSFLSRPTNPYLESSDWTQAIIWDRSAPRKDFRELEFDPEPLPSEYAPPAPVKATDVSKPKKRVRMELTAPKDKFNLSNDQFYEVSKDRSRVRQTFGQLIVEHAYPAQKLQLPFYKTRLSKGEARSFHRPALQFPLNIELRFNKVRSAKKKKDKAGRKITRGDLTEGLRTTSDLSLRDTSSFVLMEYSEEYPPVLNNFGMGSVLVNYYRKRSEKDEHVPKLDVGEPFILEPNDESPFMKLGHVASGQTIPALYNNLVRAPLFRHKPPSTDFLVIRNTVRGETKYFIREMKTFFVVGQTYPVTEVPGPHSRKITNAIKGRLQLIAFKMIQKSKGERLKISRLMKYFPDQNELQMRQRMKEFMEYHRRGPHQGFWRLKQGITIPNSQDMLKLVTPEIVVLSESMQVGERHLMDAGYGKAVDEEKVDESKLSIEQRLAPWITTKNFIHATQAKAMLQLWGEGDPSGRGEAFSFVRVSMKDIFVKAGEDAQLKMAEAANRPKSQHRYNVNEQQQAYREEINRIWNAQFDSLSRKTAPELTDDEDEELGQQQQAQRPSHSVSRHGSLKPAFREGSPMATQSPQLPGGGRIGSRAPSVALDNTSQDGRGGEASNRVLRIRRLIDGVWKMEIIRDPRVIPAYVDKRRLIEEEQMDPEDFVPTGDPETDKRQLAKLAEKVARAKKNQERRLQRKNAQIVKAGGAPLTINNQPPKADTSRRCGNCGQVGHMKTNRKCPRWAEFNPEGAASGVGGAGSPPAPNAASPPGGGMAMSPPSGASLPIPIGAAAYRAAFAHPAVSSPLATSPPVSAPHDEWGFEPNHPGTPGGSGSANGAPRIKLKVKGGGG